MEIDDYLNIPKPRLRQPKVKKPLGRPRAPEEMRLSEWIGFRLTKSEADALIAAAFKAREPIRTFVRRKILEALRLKVAR